MTPFDTSDCKERGRAFLLDLEKLCEEHAICVNLGSYDHIELILRKADPSDRPIEGFDMLYDET